MSKSIGRPLPLLLALALTAGCSHHPDLKRQAAQDNFGVEMARMNLWREAMFRFQRAVQINPADAMAHNNLAVACEANGDFEAAAREYREALRLDRSNSYIQKNYSRYTEFMSRSKKRGKGSAAATASGAAAKAAPNAATPTPATAPPVPSPVPKPPGGSR